MVFLFFKAPLFLSSFLLRSWSKLSSPFLFWHYWCRYSWLEINVISMWGKMKMLYWIKSDRIEVWRSLSRKNNTSEAQVSLVEKREHLQWKEQRKRDPHWKTYSKESIKKLGTTYNVLSLPNLENFHVDGVSVPLISAPCDLLCLLFACCVCPWGHSSD